MEGAWILVPTTEKAGGFYCGAFTWNVARPLEGADAPRIVGGAFTA